MAQTIRIYGIVQGVGFRPFVSRTADSLGIKGSVANKGSYVEIHANGSPEALESFAHALKNNAPSRSMILSLDVRSSDEPDAEDFRIVESVKETGDIFVSPDIATCPECRRELFDKNDRRYLHPFINCTNCGPRLTILDSMPYDRVRTSMGEFPMCPECEFEYTHPETRRYDAQPVCCNECGPEVYIYGGEKRGAEAITYARQAITDGKIIAVKGIGGFHLCCNALDENAVARLRQLKRRPAKPFAVMMRNLDAVSRECELDESRRQLLDGWQKPIILLKKKACGRLCGSVSPDNPTVGVMLPYAPLQMLLFDYDDGIEMTDCLVMTSGNVSGAPICRDDKEAAEEIGGFCDVILSHNRKIRLRADDTVTDFMYGKPYMIRRSRGFAPLPVMLSGALSGQVLAVGGELKNTFCIGKNNLLYLSPYVGDMADVRTVGALKESIARMEELLEAKPELVVCDMHPKYNTVAAAEELGLPLMKIQHHYAHILSCMAENDFDREVIGVSFDGTGYGTDGTIWGGEFLRASYDGFERIGSIKPFTQVGGDLSSKEGWRIAASMLYDYYGGDAVRYAERLGVCDEKSLNLIGAMAKSRVNSVTSTSCGRLFDAVSAILGIRRSSSFEGEASMSLEFAAEEFYGNNTSYSTDKNSLTKYVRDDGNFFMLCTAALVKFIAQSKIQGGDGGRLAYDFHSLLAEMTVRGCILASEKTGIRTCALSGGVFQNKLLTKMCAERLRENGFTVLLHSLVPPNDGGIALGQAAAALYSLRRQGFSRREQVSERNGKND